MAVCGNTSTKPQKPRQRRLKTSSLNCSATVHNSYGHKIAMFRDSALKIFAFLYVNLVIMAFYLMFTFLKAGTLTVYHWPM